MEACKAEGIRLGDLSPGMKFCLEGFEDETYTVKSFQNGTVIVANGEGPQSYPKDLPVFPVDEQGKLLQIYAWPQRMKKPQDKWQVEVLDLPELWEALRDLNRGKRKTSRFGLDCETAHRVAMRINLAIWMKIENGQN